MDEILAKASNQAVTFAIRSGISLASGYAIKTVTRLLDRIPASEQSRLVRLKQKLEVKIAILSQSIDLIRLSAARGNSALDACVELVSELKQDIDDFELEINDILATLSNANEKDAVRFAELKFTGLMTAINDAIPLINLSLITSGVSLSSSLDSHISPSRLLQATDHLTASNHSEDSQVGPLFDLKLYSIFYNPSRLKYLEESPAEEHNFITWKEEFARASCFIKRAENRSFDYDLIIKEDFNDGRYHNTDEENPQDRDVPRYKRMRLQDIKKQFFSASGKLLKLENSTSPVLTLKIAKNDSYEYLALGEVGNDFDEVSDSDSDAGSDSSGYESAEEDVAKEKYRHLSLLQYLLRLCSLQNSEQCSILNVNDEKLSLYLKDEIDLSLGPKSACDRHELAQTEESNKQMLSLDSNVNRLQHLTLKDGDEKEERGEKLKKSIKKP